jgi:hypothetical protein
MGVLTNYYYFGTIKIITIVDFSNQIKILKIKNCEHTHEIINMNHTMSHYFFLFHFSFFFWAQMNHYFFLLVT